MKITVCIGSSCHLKGSRQVIEELQELITKDNLKDQVELCGAFCMKNCVNGVSVTIDDKDNIFSVTPEDAKVFFETEVMNRL